MDTNEGRGELPWLCLGCDRPLRNRHQTVADRPNTVEHVRGGYCKSCMIWQPHPDPAPDLDWFAGAACAEVGGEQFFPEKGASDTPAKKICGGCDVRAQCLAYALNYERDGIWGGLSPRERQALRKKAKAA